MHRIAFAAALVAAAILAIPAVGSGAPAAGGPVKFLTGPNSGTPLEIALHYLRTNHQALGLTGADINDFAVSQYTDRGTRTTHIYLQQQYKGIQVFNAILGINVAKDGAIINAANRFVSNLVPAVNASTPGKSAHEGVGAAAKSLGLSPSDLRAERTTPHEVVFNRAGISLDPITAKLVYVPTSGAVRLAWSVAIYETDTTHDWTVNVDAVTGDVIYKLDSVDQDTYNVFAPPKESPLDGGRTLEVDPADPVASPFAWHDTNGAPGAESTLTIGNNVHAATDLDANNVPDAGSEPDGGPSLVFDFPIDLATQDPSGYRPAAVTNLFFWNNYMHDVSYHYGFTEAAGNFQENNYGNGGLAADSVNADAQDGSGVNNANFNTPADGLRPRMQMFIWRSPVTVTVNAPASIAGDYTAGSAAFGPGLTPSGLTENVVRALDPADAAGPTTFDGCSAFTNAADVAGHIALIDRGTCTFVTKVKNAQNAGAIAAIVSDIIDRPLISMGGTDPTITIPSAFLTKGDGDKLRTALGNGDTVNTTLTATAISRDSDIDNGVIAHEYTHGISNRLTGGAAGNANCLRNAERASEGWSDFVAITLTARPGQTRSTPRPIGAYVNFGTGIRPTDYSTDMTVDPVVYDDIKTNGEVHFTGYMWASALWDMYWNLVDEYGFNADIFGQYSTGGNNLALQLVMDGLKLQPCSPGFVDSRNGILLADQNLTGGANQCLIWRAFAKRGLGASANQGSSDNTNDGTQAFDVPASACGPNASVSPSSLSSTLVRGNSETKSLSIGNTGLAGADDLHWTITEAASDCSSPSDLTWVSESPTSGTVGQAVTFTAQVTFNTANLTPAQTYTGVLCISSDDPDTPTTSVPISLLVQYAFTGFFGNVKNPPTLNPAAAGATAPLTFSLAGNWGLSIFDSGYPKSQQIDCSTKAPIGPATSTSTPPGNPLSYNATLDRYTYPWKTLKSYAGTCRQFLLKLNDGSATHTVYFQFS